MNVLYCIPHLYNAGGMERVLTQKVNWLAAHSKHRFTILTTETPPEQKPFSFFRLHAGVHIEKLSIGFDADYAKPLPAKWWGHMRRMRAYEKVLTEYIRTHHIDLCISLGGKEIAFLHRLPCRTIAEMHFARDQRQQLLQATHSGRLWALLGRIRTRQLVHAVRPLERLIVLTDADWQQWHQAGCNNVTVIPNPCCIDSTKTSVPSEKNKTLLAVGRLHAQKGMDLLLQAWQPVERKHPGWTLRIVGEGPQRDDLDTLIRRLKLQRVVLAGNVQDITQAYTSASLFVLSSRFEGLPLALIEAMWCGLPCVAFGCPHGPAELLAGERGWLVPNGDIAALTGQIEYAIMHPEEATARAQHAQEYARHTYSEDAIMPQWLNIINGE